MAPPWLWALTPVCTHRGPFASNFYALLFHTHLTGLRQPGPITSVSPLSSLPSQGPVAAFHIQATDLKKRLPSLAGVSLAQTSVFTPQSGGLPTGTAGACQHAHGCDDTDCREVLSVNDTSHSAPVHHCSEVRRWNEASLQQMDTFSNLQNTSRRRTTAGQIISAQETGVQRTQEDPEAPTHWPNKLVTRLASWGLIYITSFQHFP